MSRVSRFLVCLLVFFALVISYSNLASKVPISYYDEVLWVEDSYFFQYYLKGDFDSEIWQTTIAKDQPMLTKLVFGAWLYPLYLEEKLKVSDPNFDFSKFLISNGFPFVNRETPEYNAYYLENRFESGELTYGDVGHEPELVQKYGNDVLKTTALIKHVRKLNIVIAALTLALTFWFVLRFKGLKFASIFTFLYAFNPLVIQSLVVAHSEALFVLFFNLSLGLMLLIFVEKNTRLVVPFSIFAGLCMATKLNGIILFMIYIYLTIFYFIKPEKLDFRELLTKVIKPFVVMILVFTALNPFTYKNPFKNIPEMFSYRLGVVQYQVKRFPEVKLESPKARVMQIYNNFFDDKLGLGFNSVVFNTTKSVPGKLLLTLFLIGLLQEVRQVKKNRLSLVVAFSFLVLLVSMVNYLYLNWARYYLPLVLFILYYQLVGVFLVFGYLTSGKFLND